LPVTSPFSRLRDENVGLVTLWRYNSGKPAISFWRSVFERRAPQAIAPTERLIGKPIGQGTTTNQVTRELLTAIENAYQSASSADTDLGQATKQATLMTPGLNKPRHKPVGLQTSRLFGPSAETNSRRAGQIDC
jgi:hypothetical protein